MSGAGHGPHVGSRLLSLSAGTILDVAPADAVDVAAAAGFAAVGVWYDHSTWTADVARKVAARLDHHGLIALDIEPIMLGRGDDHGEAIVDAALHVGARHVLVASRDGENQRVSDRLASLAERLTGTPVRLVLEFLPALGVRTFAQAREIVDSVGHPALGILVDALHLARSGSTIDDVRRTPTQLLPYVQLCDAPADLADPTVERLIHEALHGRSLPGDGSLALDELLDAAPAADVSLEIRSAELMAAFSDPVERARAVLASVHTTER